MLDNLLGTLILQKENLNFYFWSHERYFLFFKTFVFTKKYID